MTWQTCQALRARLEAEWCTHAGSRSLCHSSTSEVGGQYRRQRASWRERCSFFPRQVLQYRRCFTSVTVVALEIPHGPCLASADLGAVRSVVVPLLAPYHSCGRGRRLTPYSPRTAYRHVGKRRDLLGPFPCDTAWQNHLVDACRHWLAQRSGRPGGPGALSGTYGLQGH